MKQHALTISGKLTRREILVSTLVLVIYAVGMAGMIIPYTNSLFIRLIPVVIILSLSATLLFHVSYDTKTIAAFFLIGVTAWTFEALGVNTGVIFGEYSYGHALGPQLSGTPLLIGLNWLLLIYGTAALAEDLKIKHVFKVIIASVAMVVFDLLLETLAPRMNMWRFEAGTAPFRNYLAWFIISLLFHSSLRLMGIKFNNHIAKVVFIVQFVFFLLLSMTLQIK